jgi:formylglycine-generating enzyme required for sulfatase activity
MPTVRRSTRASLPALAIVTGLAGAVLARSGQSSAGRYHESIPGTLVTFEMVRVPAGAGVAEFHIGRTEVTWDMFDVYMLRLDEKRENRAADAVARPSEPYGAPDRGWGHAGFPAMSVTATAAEAFCQWLSVVTGKIYRLPTDEEWSRAATLATTFSGTAVPMDAMAWHAGNSERRVHAVGQRAPDALGLADLFGNVAEWTSAGNGRFVTRGGSFRDPASSLGPAARAAQDAAWNQTDPQLPKSRWWLSDGPFVGFRVVAYSPRQSSGGRP